MSKHKFEPSDKHGVGGADTNFCKFKYCPKCKCLKEIWHKGTTFWKDDKFYDNEPKCK